MNLFNVAMSDSKSQTWDCLFFNFNCTQPLHTCTTGGREKFWE